VKGSPPNHQLEAFEYEEFFVCYYLFVILCMYHIWKIYLVGSEGVQRSKPSQVA
jgi:hypothetical protein